MCFSKKTLLVGAILGFVFIASPAFASTLTTWQNMVSNGTTTLYWVSSFGNSDYFFLNSYYEFDLSGFAYWQAPTTTQPTYFPGIFLAQPTYPVNRYISQTIPTDSEGYKFWTITNFSSASYFRYTSGGNPYYNLCEIKKSIILADKTLYLKQCAGVHQNPITNVWYDPLVSQVYLLVYTDDNLDNLIFDENSLYVYLNNLSNYNAIYGQWSPESGITLPAGTCDDLGTFAGALCRVITYLFQPTESALTQFSKLKDIIASKPPFGYFTSIKGYLSALSATSTPAFALTAEIGNISIFGTLKTGLTWILWLFFGFWVIKRIAKFDF